MGRSFLFIILCPKHVETVDIESIHRQPYKIHQCCCCLFFLNIPIYSSSFYSSSSFPSSASFLPIAVNYNKLFLLFLFKVSFSSFLQNNFCNISLTLFISQIYHFFLPCIYLCICLYLSTYQTNFPQLI